LNSGSPLLKYSHQPPLFWPLLLTASSNPEFLTKFSEAAQAELIPTEISEHNRKRFLMNGNNQTSTTHACKDELIGHEITKR
jgi:hypothetical protein